MKTFKLPDLYEFLVALLFVGALTGGLTYWAKAKSTTPPPLQTVQGAEIELFPNDATLDGGIKLYPTTIEDQKDGFTYNHGRKILKEQTSRKAGEWTDLESSLSWTFNLKAPQKYQIALSYSSESDGGEIEVSLDKKRLKGTLQNTGTFDTWQDLELGEIVLPAGTHTLVLKGKTLTGAELLRLQQVTLTPVQP